MQSMSRLQLNMQTGVICVFLQLKGQLCLGSVVISILSPWGGGELPATLVPTMGLLQKHTTKAGRSESRAVLGSRLACTMDMMLCCTPAGLILQAAPHPHLIPSEPGSRLSFFIKAVISTSGLPSAPWLSLPAHMSCQALPGLGLINSGSAPAMETGCCSGAWCRAMM